MREETTILTLLQVAVPANTLLTVSAEVKILESLGIVSNPELVRAMNLSLSLMPSPSTTAATLKGLVQLLSALVKMNQKTTKADHASLEKLVVSLAGTPDAPLTFGTFLQICESLLKARHKLHLKEP
jgi:hypothetical protein